MKSFVSELLKIAAGLGLLALLTSCGSSKSVTGKVVDAQTGAPIPDAHVQITSYSVGDMYSSVALGEVISKQADGQGKFSIEATKRYSWTICAWKAGYYPEAIGKAEFQGSVSLTKAKRAENADVESMNRWRAGAQYRSGEGSPSWAEYFRIHVGRVNLADVKGELLRFKQFQEASPEEQATEGKASTHITRLQSSDPMVRQQAGEALAKLGKEANPAIPTFIAMYKSKDPRDHSIANSALQNIGRDAIPPLVELLKDQDPRVRRTAVDALEFFQPHDPAAIAEAFIGALTDTDSWVRASAARNLSGLARSWRVKVPEIVSALTTTLKDPDEEVRTQAAWSLWMMGEARVAEPVLKELVRSKNPNSRRFAETALKGIR